MAHAPWQLLHQYFTPSEFFHMQCQLSVIILNNACTVKQIVTHLDCFIHIANNYIYFNVYAVFYWYCCYLIIIKMPTIIVVNIGKIGFVSRFITIFKSNGNISNSQ